MRVLVACEFSGVVREAFRCRGHEAYSCDLLSDGSVTSSPYHLQMDVNLVLNYPSRVLGGYPFWMRRGQWDLMIAHPPCQYLSVSGMHRTTRGLRDPQLTKDALRFVQMLLERPIQRIALENPIGVISTRIRKPDQIIQPYQFGHNASKRTCLWLKGLPLLKADPKQFVAGRIVGEDARGRTVVRWANQTDSGQNKLGPSKDRWAKRAQTYQGIADAMADQWGGLCAESDTE